MSQGIYLRALPRGTAEEMVSESLAERTTRKGCEGPCSRGKVSTFAVLATDRRLDERQPDGTMRREISNRAVWVFVYPKRLVQGFMENSVDFVDGRTGKFLEGVGF